MTAGTDEKLYRWMANIWDVHAGAEVWTAGSFLMDVTRAALYADDDNYAILRPALLKLAAKYPQYYPKEKANARNAS